MSSIMDFKRSPVTEGLIKEAIEAVKKPHQPMYYEGIGFERSGCTTGSPYARAKAIEALFCDSTPKIYMNDLIAGSVKSLCTDASEEEIKKYTDLAISYDHRGFSRNSDHFCGNFRKLMVRGIPGYIEDIKASKEVHKNDAEKIEMLDSMEFSLKCMIKLMENYADKAEELIGTPGYTEGALKFIAANSRALCNRAPETFAEGLQLLFYVHTCFNYESRYAMAFGRMDQYLYPLYKKDIDNGTMKPETAIVLLENVFVKLAYRWDVVNIAIGGMNVNGESEVNELSYAILCAVRNVNLPGPNLSARIAPSTEKEFLDECLKVIGTGLGYPALMNDTVNIAALSKYGYAKEDVYDYCMVGCIENFISGKQVPWFDNRYDSPRFFEYLFNNGKAIKFPEDGISTGPVEDINSMEELLEKFKIQLQDGVKKYVDMVNAYNYVEDKKSLVSPYLSCFCDDCIGRGLDINMGGAIYKSAHGLCAMGVGTVTDSLAAIEKVVFVDKEATLMDIRDAMIANFDGYEDLRQKLLNAPKYGNDDDFADKYAIWFIDLMSEEVLKYHTNDDGGYYLAMAANTANIAAGTRISATPDGRLAGESLSDAASPTHGRDVNGFTSVINSLTKPDYCGTACGSVINQKMSPGMFEDGKRDKILSAIRVYFNKGGQEMQINSTSREVLIDAMKNPDNYRDLVVRVSGFSAIFVTLPVSVQEDILLRTQHV